MFFNIILGSCKLSGNGKEALFRCILNILNVMHTGIKKLMRENEKFQDILHRFDSWRVGKSLLKKFMKASQKERL